MFNPFQKYKWSETEPFVQLFRDFFNKILELTWTFLTQFTELFLITVNCKLRGRHVVEIGDKGEQVSLDSSAPGYMTGKTAIGYTCCLCGKDFLFIPPEEK